MKTTAQDTFQTVSIDTPAGRRLLRRIEKTGREDWHWRADAESGWRVRFWRDIPGAIGEPRATVEVETDAVISLRGQTGPAVSGIGGNDSVDVPASRYAGGWGYTARTVARLLADGWRLEILHSAGSESSRRHGLAFAYLEAYTGGNNLAVTISETVYAGGRVIVCGAVNP